jgi:hypothetical protein
LEKNIVIGIEESKAKQNSHPSRVLDKAVEENNGFKLTAPHLP